MLKCPSCGKEYDTAKEKHVPQIVEDTRGLMVIRYSSGCKVEKL